MSGMGARPYRLIGWSRSESKPWTRSESKPWTRSESPVDWSREPP